MKYVVAVSGGVDSVVLLDMLRKQKEHKLIVAHFDHGIRPESDADARFVWELAKSYQLPFEVRREELGENAGEAQAREHRYMFLREIAMKYNATIVTAHHQDDLLETIAINLVRGTGWRGLAVMGDESIKRPLIGMKKSQLYDYAARQNLEFVEDETNHQRRYLRNQLRQLLHKLSPDARRTIIEGHQAQIVLKRSITREVSRFVTNERYFFIMIDEAVALELLRQMTRGTLTRPRLLASLYAIKTAKAGTVFEVGERATLRLQKQTFDIVMPEPHE